MAKLSITKGSVSKLDITKASKEAGSEKGTIRLYAGLEWTGKLDLDVMAIACIADGKALNSDSINFFHQQTSPCGGTIVSEDNRDGEDSDEPNEYGLTHDECVLLNLPKYPAEVTHIDILLHCFEEPSKIAEKKAAGEAILSFGDCDEAFVELIDLDLFDAKSDKSSLGRLDLAFDSSNAQTILFGKVMRRGDAWAWVTSKPEEMEIEGELGTILTSYGYTSPVA